MNRTTYRLSVVAVAAILAPVVASCGGDDDDDSSSPTAAAAIEPAATDPATDADPPPDDAASADDNEPASPDDAQASADDGDSAGDGGDEPDAGGGGNLIDGSGVDWATVDLTTVDWQNIDLSTIDLDALAANPTAENLDEATVAFIQDRFANEVQVAGGDVGSGEATLTIGDQTWEFTGFVCAFGFTNTESEVFSFSSNAFGTLDDGTRTQLQADIWDDSGQDVLTGPETSHEVTFDDIENFDDPAVDFMLLGPELTFDGTTVSVEGDFEGSFRGSDFEVVPGSFVGDCGPGSRL